MESRGILACISSPRSVAAIDLPQLAASARNRFSSAGDSRSLSSLVLVGGLFAILQPVICGGPIISPASEPLATVYYCFETVVPALDSL